MKTFKVTIKEKFTDLPIVTSFIGDVDEDFVIAHFGCKESDVEWYKIEEEK